MNPITKSGLDKIDISPLDYWWRYLRPEREPYVKNKKTAFDDALRMAVFEPKLFTQKYVKIPTINKRTNLGKAEFESLTKTAEASGQELLSADDYEKIIGMQDAILKHPTAKILCTAGYVSDYIEFLEPHTDCPIKFKPHYVHNGGIVVDLRSSEDASFQNFQKEAGNFRLDKKAVIQTEGLGIKTDGLSVDGMAFILIEQDAPYKIGIYHLDDRSLAFGRETVIRNCETYLKCVSENKWPGLDERILPASLPEWVLRKNQ